MNHFQAGKVVSFRLPSDTPKNILEYLNAEKEKNGRGFGTELAHLLMEGIESRTKKIGNEVLIPLPDNLSESQKNWLREETTKQILVQWLFQIMSGSIQPFSMDTVQQEEKKEDFQTSAYHQRLASANFFDDED